jgi:hypothetical protein
MNIRDRGLRQLLGSWLSVLIVALSVAVPVLERADLARTTAFESRHDPGACAPSHNHTLCTQVGASHALPSRQQVRVGIAPYLRGPSIRHLGSAFVSARADGHPTRAPPSA